MTSFKALYGRPPPVIVPYELGTSMVQEVDLALWDRDAVLHELMRNLEKARAQNKFYADKGRREEEFEEGDWVYLRLRPYRQHTMFQRIYQKLASRFFGPFKVCRRIGRVAYHLELPPSSRIHPVFHVSLLCRRIGDTDVHPTLLLPMTDQGLPDIELEEVLARHTMLVKGHSQDQLLIKWKWLLADDVT